MKEEAENKGLSTHKVNGFWRVAVIGCDLYQISAKSAKRYQIHNGVKTFMKSHVYSDEQLRPFGIIVTTNRAIFFKNFVLFAS